MAVSQIDNNGVNLGQMGNRNLIVNSAMQVAQRGTSVTGVTTSGYKTCDRMEVVVSNLGTYTVTQENDAPEGFANSLKIACTVADASPASSDYVFFAHKLEGQNLQNLKKGTSDALPVTLSFWVKSNMTGTYQVNARDQDNVRYISASYTVDASGAWEYKTITLAGDTTGVLDNDANESLKLEWWLDSGSNFNSGTLNTSWTAANNVNRNAGATVNIGDSTSNYWQITGVQLEVGDTATPFEHRSYGDELARCQRYCYVINYNAGNPIVFHGYWGASTTFEGFIEFPVTMRSSPSLTIPTVGSLYALEAQVAWRQLSAVSIGEGSIEGLKVACTAATNSSFVKGQGGAVGIRASGNIQFDAEL